MKTILNNRITFAFLAVLSVIFFSCQKENSLAGSEPVTEEASVNYSNESLQADGSFDDVGELSQVAADEDDEASANAGENGRPGNYFPSFRELRLIIGDCATITVSPNNNSYPKTITINFGDSCVGPDGKLRSGKIILHLTGPIRRPGSVLTITLVNFYLNHVGLKGTKIVSNLSAGTAVKFTVQVVGGQVSFPNGRGYKYESFKYKKQVAGMNTLTPRDNVFEITGWANIRYNNGTTVMIETIDPLIKKVACSWISDGTLKIKINSRLLKLDFGYPDNGACDNKALLTWNDGNNQKVITLP